MIPEKTTFYHYQCINRDCRKLGVTAHPPVFQREIYGHFCPDCWKEFKPGNLAVYCTVCGAVTGMVAPGEAIPAERLPVEPILFVDECHQCKRHPRSPLRTTLLPLSTLTSDNADVRRQDMPVGSSCRENDK